MKRKEAEIKRQLQAQQGGVHQVANLRQLEAQCARQASTFAVTRGRAALTCP